jgi:phytoene synthase
VTAEALSSFEAKWSAAHPELPMALRFASSAHRPLVSALACLGHEIAHAAFHIDEAEVASAKLHWWADELTALPSGQARHPLTGVLAGHAPARKLASADWLAIVEGAVAQRNAAPVSTLGELLAGYRQFELALARVESTIHGGIDIDTTAQAMSLSRALRESMRLTQVLTRGDLPLPLDLLARHGLSRVDLARTHPARDAALREHFGTLAAAIGAGDRRKLSVLAAISLHADRLRARRASRAADPLVAIGSGLDRLPFSSAWAGWRAARRLQASP